ncbi:unnamed protein product [Dovyalis caffra]|uniref:Uncharacterized protein n=1 Tax=Dovyalis caffra TaxID=77055 RepID=A0AAV1RDX3_9ROSI|nr:unnamed protein product [Dovyalis caffra]
MSGGLHVGGLQQQKVLVVDLLYELSACRGRKYLKTNGLKLSQSNYGRFCVRREHAEKIREDGAFGLETAANIGKEKETD